MPSTLFRTLLYKRLWVEIILLKSAKFFFARDDEKIKFKLNSTLA